MDGNPGASFDAKLMAVGSLVGSKAVPLMAEDEELCGTLGISTAMAGKLARVRDANPPTAMHKRPAEDEGFHGARKRVRQ